MLRRSAGLLARIAQQQATGIASELQHLAAASQIFPERIQTALPSLRHWRSGDSQQSQAASASTDSSTSAFTARPHSLEFDRAVEVPQEGVEQSWWKKLALQAGGYYSRESRLLRGARYGYEAVTEQAENNALYQAVGLEKRFAHEYSMLCIHVWMLLMRLRDEGDDGAQMSQMMYEDFQEDVEMRVRASGLKVRLGHHLKELEKNFYGSSMAYDQALEGKESLPSALVRNVYGEETGRQAQAGSLATYITREIACLKLTPSEALMGGKFKFSTGVD